MNVPTGFRLPHVCLPRPGIDLRKWAVIACDQYTAEPEYWRQVAREVGDAPSTLHLIFPEVYLGAPDAPARIAPHSGDDAPLPGRGAVRRARRRGAGRAHASAVACAAG